MRALGSPRCYSPASRRERASPLVPDRGAACGWLRPEVPPASGAAGGAGTEVAGVGNSGGRCRQHVLWQEGHSQQLGLTHSQALVLSDLGRGVCSLGGSLLLLQPVQLRRVPGALGVRVLGSARCPGRLGPLLVPRGHGAAEARRPGVARARPDRVRAGHVLRAPRACCSGGRRPRACARSRRACPGASRSWGLSYGGGGAAEGVGLARASLRGQGLYRVSPF